MARARSTSRRGRNVLRRAPPQGTPITVPKSLEAQHIRFMRRHANAAIAISAEELGRDLDAVLAMAVAEVRRDGLVAPEPWERFDASKRFQPIQSVRDLVNRMRATYRARFDADAAIEHNAEMQGRLDRANQRRWEANVLTQIAQDPEVPTAVGPAVVASKPQVSTRTRRTWVRRNVDAVVLGAIRTGQAAKKFFKRSKTIPEEYFDRVEATITQGVRQAAKDVTKARARQTTARQAAEELQSRGEPVTLEIEFELRATPEAEALEEAARATRERLDNERGIARRRAKIIGRDQTEKFNGDATEERNVKVGVDDYRWNTQRDTRVRRLHRDREGQIFSWKEPPSDGHPGEPIECFPATTLVRVEGLVAVTRRMWHGQMAHVRTSTGRLIRATPNHPVLTNRGWVGLGHLDLGDYIIEVIEDESGVCDDDERVPCFGDLFESVRLGGTSEIRSGGEFHGDASDEQVNIVFVDRKLHLDIQPSLEGKKAKLVGTEANLLLFEYGALPELVRTAFGSANRIVSGLDSGEPLIARHARPSRFHGVRSTPDGGAPLVECGSNGVAVAPVLDGQLELGDSRVVFRAHRVDSVSLKKWSGHVFNAQTDSGWYQAQGFISRNCRCWAAGAFAAAFKSGQLVARTQPPTPLRRGRLGPIRPAELPEGVNPGQIAFQREVFEASLSPEQVAREERDRRFGAGG